MHEFSLVINILELAEDYARREQASAIQTVALRVGALSGVEPEALEFAFSVAKQDTLASHARLEVEYVQPSALCQNCDLEFLVENRFGVAFCPTCHAQSTNFVHGNELEVRYLEVV
jgi:hydrogenase nickel incorporation protein HypA/HybF